MTYNAHISKALLDLGLELSTFSEPERESLLRDMIALENKILEDTRAGQEELVLTTNGDQVYTLPAFVFSVDSLTSNGSDYTPYRVDAQQITLRE